MRTLRIFPPNGQPASKTPPNGSPGASTRPAPPPGDSDSLAGLLDAVRGMLVALSGNAMSFTPILAARDRLARAVREWEGP
jgi:hypothetical protein